MSTEWARAELKVFCWRRHIILFFNHKPVTQPCTYLLPWYSLHTYSKEIVYLCPRKFSSICRTLGHLLPHSETRNVIQQTTVGDSKACFSSLRKPPFPCLCKDAKLQLNLNRKLSVHDNYLNLFHIQMTIPSLSYCTSGPAHVLPVCRGPHLLDQADSHEILTCTNPRGLSVNIEVPQHL